MASSAGYSGTPLPSKLGIKPGMRVALRHAPITSKQRWMVFRMASSLGHGLRPSQRVDLIIALVTERDHLARNIGWLVTTLPPDGALWVAWPKRAAKVPTDMTDHALGSIALPMGWVDVEVCAQPASIRQGKPLDQLARNPADPPLL